MEGKGTSDFDTKMERDKLMYRTSPPPSPDARPEISLQASAKRQAFKNLRQESQAPLDFDDLLPHVGEFGKYQKLLVFLVCLPACIPCGIHAFSQLFMAPVPEHWCKVGGPELRVAAANVLRIQKGFGDENLRVGSNIGDRYPFDQHGTSSDETVTTPFSASHIEEISQAVTPPVFIGRPQREFLRNEFEKDYPVTENSDSSSISEPFSLNEPPENGLSTSSPDVTTRVPETNRGRHHHEQRRSKKHYKSFMIPNSLIRVVTGSRTQKRNTPLGVKYPLRGSRNYNHKPAPYFSKSFGESSFKERVSRSVDSDVLMHEENIIRRGKYSLVEEDGHESHVHHPHDEQLLNIFETIAVIEERLERSLLSLDGEEIKGPESTELPQSIEINDNSSFLTVTENLKDYEVNNDIDFLMPEQHGSEEYTIPILTPMFKTASHERKFRETRQRKFTFLPINSRQQDDKNKDMNSRIIDAHFKRTEKENSNLAEPSRAPKYPGFFEADEELKNEPEKLKENHKFEVKMEGEELNEVTGSPKANKSQPVESHDELNYFNGMEYQDEDFDLLIEKFIRDIFIPKEATGKYSCCARFDIVPELELLDVEPSNASADWAQVECDQGWIYDTSSVKSSIVIDFDLVCTRAIFPTIGLAILNVGGIIGVYFFGTLSDRLGRRASFLLCLATQQVSALVTAAAPSYAMWLICRFCVGLTIPAIYQIPFIISMELVGPNYRSFVTVLTCLFYVGGMMMLAGIAYLVRDWQLLCVVTSLPFFAYIIYWWFLPESPRWLLGRGRLHEASKILQSMARVNGAQLPESFQQSLASQMLAQQAASRSSDSRKEKTLDLDNEAGFCALWQTPNMRLKTLLIILVWFANETVYVGLSYYGPVMGENEYLAFFLSCLVEVPSYCFCWVVMDRWGRRWILGVGMILGGLCSIATVLTPPESTVVAQSFYLVAKFAEAAAFLIIYPFSAELFPTAVRGMGIGFAAYVGGLGLIVIPFINYLGSEMLSLPLVIMGVLSVVGGVATFRLPETLHQPLPNTIKEGEEFGANFSWTDCWSCKPKDDDSGSDEDSVHPHESKKYRDEIIDLTTLNRLSIEETGPLRRCRNDMSLLADESDYITENEYSVDEDDSSDSDYCAQNRLRYQRSRRRRTSQNSSHGSPSPFYEDETDYHRRSEFFSTSSEGPRDVEISVDDDIATEPKSVQRNESHDGRRPATSTEASGPLSEGSPKLKRGSTKRGKLVKQASIVPIITDSTGAMKMTFWM